MYGFFMDLFERYPKFFTFFLSLSGFGLLAILFVIALIFYKIIALAHRGRPKKRMQSDVDREQDEKIEEISKETKKALALQSELDSLHERLGVPKEE